MAPTAKGKRHRWASNAAQPICKSAEIREQTTKPTDSSNRSHSRTRKNVGNNRNTRMDVGRETLKHPRSRTSVCVCVCVYARMGLCMCVPDYVNGCLRLRGHVHVRPHAEC